MTDNNADNEEECGVCGNTRKYHTNKIHAFSSDGRLEEAKPSMMMPSSPGGPRSQTAPQVATIGDPVLRMVMVRKGLITPDELLAADLELRSTGIMFSVPTTGEVGSDNRPGAPESAERDMRHSGEHPSRSGPASVN